MQSGGRFRFDEDVETPNRKFNYRQTSGRTFVTILCAGGAILSFFALSSPCYVVVNLLPKGFVMEVTASLWSIHIRLRELLHGQKRYIESMMEKRMMQSLSHNLNGQSLDAAANRACSMDLMFLSPQLTCADLKAIAVISKIVIAFLFFTIIVNLLILIIYHIFHPRETSKNSNQHLSQEALNLTVVYGLTVPAICAVITCVTYAVGAQPSRLAGIGSSLATPGLGLGFYVLTVWAMWTVSQPIAAYYILPRKTNYTPYGSLSDFE